MSMKINNFYRASTVAMQGKVTLPNEQIATENYTMWFTMKASNDPALTDEEAVLQKSFPVAINGLNSLTFPMELTPADTDIVEQVTYYYDFVLIGDTTHKVYPFTKGTVKVLNKITGRLS